MVHNRERNEEKVEVRRKAREKKKVMNEVKRRRGDMEFKKWK